MNRSIALIAGIVVLAGIGYFLSQITSRTSPEVQATTTVELKNGDTYEIIASPVSKEIGGKAFQMLAYNGSIPGPTIRVPQGAEIIINFKNQLDMPTLLHSHGVRMDVAYDGSQTSQEEIQPGETFSYKLRFPDAGIYWYHPHVREDYQQELGLYGAFVVEPTDANYYPEADREVVLFLDDILIENGVIDLSETQADRTMMGRFGNVMLVNGQENFTLEAKQGEVVRLFLVNASNVRPFNFSLDGQQMKLLGSDGGAYEKERWATSILLSPSERATVDVLIEESVPMVSDTPRGDIALGLISVSGQVERDTSAFPLLTEHAATVKSIQPFYAYMNTPPDKQLKLLPDLMMGQGGHMMSDGTMMGGMMGGVPEGGIEWEDDMWMMNAMSNAENTKWHIEDAETGKRDMDIEWTFAKDVPVKIRIENPGDSMHPMQHPIHFHGQRFLVVSMNGNPVYNLAWKDTVLVPAGQYVDIILDPSNPGEWMAHCHIAEHLEAGMMMTYDVI